MGEAHDPVADGDDLGALGLGQRAVAGHRVDDRERRLAHRRGHGEAAACGGREAAEAGAHERLERHGQPLARLQVQRPGLHRAAQLEREERVPAGQLVHVMEDRARGHPVESALQEALHGAEAERGKGEALEAIGGGRTVEVQRGRRLPRRAQREQQADAVVRQPPRGEGEHCRRGPVEPLHVVDSHDERRRTGEHPQRGQRGERDGLRVGCLPAAVGHQEGDLERVPQWAGKLVQEFGTGAEEVSERRVGEAGLRLGRARRDRLQTRLGRAGQGRLPQRRLADARLAFDQQRPRALGDGLEEPLHAQQLLVPSDELDLHGCGGRPYSGAGIRAIPGRRHTRRCARRRSRAGRACTTRACPCRSR